MSASPNLCDQRRIVVHTSEPSSGAARYVFELVKGLAGTGAPVVLFCPSNFEYLQELKASRVEVFLAGTRGIKPARFGTRVLRNLTFLVHTAWRQLRATKNGDIIHFQFPLYLIGLVFFLLAALKNCPIVFTAHDPLPHKWMWPERFRFLERKMHAWVYWLSRHVIVHNETGRKILIREFGLDPKKLSIIAHGPFSSPDCCPNLPPFDELRLLAFGSIRQNKGTHLAIQAVQRLNARPGLRIRLTIAGSVANAREQRYWSECKVLIEKQPEGIRVIEHYISDAEAGQLLRDHHALLLPYLDFSSESGVASLALSNRRAILATCIGGLGTLLDSCGCGIPIESATVEGVADAIAKARNGGHNVLERIGAKGEAFLSSTRSWSQISTETLAVYAELLEAEQSAWSNETPAAVPHQDGGDH